jgi:type II secretory pathway component PulC
MSYKYLILNTVLCFVILSLAFKNYEAWRVPTEFLPHTGIVPNKSEAKNANLQTTASINEPMSIESYNLIAGKNIFSPERKDFPVLSAAVVETKKPIVRPQIVLYGVTIAEDYQAATIVNPGRPLRKEERETMSLKIGEKIGEYKLAKILPDRIAMESNGDTFELLLYDSKNPKKRMEPRTETKPAMIASPQPAPVPPSGKGPKPIPSPESAEKLKEMVQAQISTAPTSLPFNKYTYQLFPPSAVISRGTISYPPRGSSAQESVGK